MGRHTILLVQPAGPTTRTYYDYPSVPEAVNAVVAMYEKQLKQMNPRLQHITYDIQHLLSYVDELRDLSALVFDNQTQFYVPYGKDWIKGEVYKHLRTQAGGR